MARLTVEEQFDIAIKIAARTAEVDLPSRQVAEDFYRSERDLVDHFAREWMVEKLAFLIRRHRATERAKSDPQMLLGFRVPKKLTLKSGKTIPFGKGTLRKLRMRRAQVWKEARAKKDGAVERLDQAIALMEPYAAVRKAITYSEVVALELEKRTKHGHK